MRLYIDALLHADDEQLMQIAADAHRRELTFLYYLITGAAMPDLPPTTLSDDAVQLWTVGSNVDELAAHEGVDRSEVVRRLIENE